MIGRADKNGPQGDGVNEDVSFTLKQTFVLDSIGWKAESVRLTETAPTLRAVHYKFPPCVMDGAMNKPICYGISSYCSNSMLSDNPQSGIYEATTSRTLDLNGGNPACNQGGIMVLDPMILDMTHASDVLRISEDGTVPTLQHRMGTGGNQVPLVVERKEQEHMQETDKNSVPSQRAAGVDCRNMNQYDELYPTLQAKPNGGQSLNFSGAVIEPTYTSSKASFFTMAEKELENTLVATDYKDPPLINDTDGMQYIVRRLTPTECARLQGFPDWWGELPEIEDMSDDEYEFWKDILKTHTEVNVKTYREKTKSQMIAWYNKLHTDSAEYKMWGNGIALPPALYCMQGMVDALNAYADIEDLRIEIEQDG